MINFHNMTKEEFKAKQEEVRNSLKLNAISELEERENESKGLNPGEENEMIHLLKKYPNLIRTIDKRYITKDMALTAVKSDPTTISFLDWHSKEVRFEAVGSAGWTISLIDSEYRNSGLYQIAIDDANPAPLSQIQDIDEEYHSYTTIMMPLIKRNPKAILKINRLSKGMTDKTYITLWEVAISNDPNLIVELDADTFFELESLDD